MEIVKDKLVINNSKVIDYISHYIDDYGELCLPIKCKFFFGNIKGLAGVFIIFNAAATIVKLSLSRWDCRVYQEIFLYLKSCGKLRINDF